MSARRAAVAVLVTAGLSAPGLAQAAHAGTPGCASEDMRLGSDFVVGASSDSRNVRAGGHWVSDMVVTREVLHQQAPAADVAVTITLRLADGHLVTSDARTDSLGRARFDVTIPTGAAAGPASVLWAASEEIDPPCGPRVDTYGERWMAQGVRVIR